MKRYISLIFILLACLQACSDRGRVIPADEMTDIYVDLFLADQWLRENPSKRDIADTTLFFEPVFRKYGYSFKDYNASLDYYAGDIDQLSEITSAASVKMKQMKDHYEALVEHNREVRLINEEQLPDYTEQEFNDSDWSMYQLAEPDSLALRDSLAVRDSLDVGKDSLLMDLEKGREALDVPVIDDISFDKKIQIK